MDVEITLWDKVMPLRLMGRHVGLFDRVEHSAPIEHVTRIERVVLPALPYGSLAVTADTNTPRALPAQDTPVGERYER